MIYAQDGNDQIFAGYGSDFVDGGDGFDVTIVPYDFSDFNISSQTDDKVVFRLLILERT